MGQLFSERLPFRRTSITGGRRIKGIILAAGDGTRIRKVTYGAFPKELLPIGNVPTIRFPLEALKLAGVKSALIVIAALTKHGIVDGLQSGRKFDMDLCYVVQEKGEGLRSGIGSALLTARSWVGCEDFGVALGDTIVCNLSGDNPMDCLGPLINIHRATDSIATILVYPTKADTRRFGVVKFKNLKEYGNRLYGEVERMVEKPDETVAKQLRVNGYNYAVAGYYVFKPTIFDYIEKTKPDGRNELQITDAMELAIQNGEKVYAVVHADNDAGKIHPHAYWDVGIPEDYKDANVFLLKENIEKWLDSEE